MLSPSKVSENAMIKYHNNKNQRIAFARFAGFLVSNKTVLKSASPWDGSLLLFFIFSYLFASAHVWNSSLSTTLTLPSLKDITVIIGAVSLQWM